MNPIDEILENEGGYQNDPADKGNYHKGVLIGTNWGISAPVLAGWLGRTITADDMRNLSEEDAREIYERRYLSGPRIHTLPEPVQTFVLDAAVNHGPGTAIKLLQRVLNAAEFGPVDVDGVIGPATRNVVNEALTAMGNYLMNALVDERIAFYRAIVQRDPTQRRFLAGWIRRAESFRLPV